MAQWRSPGSTASQWGLPEKVVAEAERLFQRARNGGEARVGGDPDDGVQSQRRHPETGIARDNGIEPGSADGMLGSVPAKRVDQDVDVGQDHPERFMRSRYSISSSS